VAEVDPAPSSYLLSSTGNNPAPHSAGAQQKILAAWVPRRPLPQCLVWKMGRVGAPWRAQRSEQLRSRPAPAAAILWERPAEAELPSLPRPQAPALPTKEIRTDVTTEGTPRLLARTQLGAPRAPQVGPTTRLGHPRFNRELPTVVPRVSAATQVSRVKLLHLFVQK